MRKCISVLLCMILVLSLCGTAFAGQGTYMEVDTALADGKVTVTVKALKAAANARLCVEFDTDYLRYVGAETDFAVSSVAEADGTLTIGLASATAASLKPGEVALKLTFAVTGSWDQTARTINAERWNGAVCGDKFTASLIGPGYRFEDVRAESWYFEIVDAMADMGHIKGMTPTTFGPDLHMSRGMFVTLLGRMAGVEEKLSQTPFSDVEAESYYSGYIAWAAENGIVNGMSSNRFAPDMDMTREQMATVLYRYASFCGEDVNVDQPDSVLKGFADADKISEYARVYMIWAVDRGIIKGKTPYTLCPQDSATRAEAAAMLYRFCYDQ